MNIETDLRIAAKEAKRNRVIEHACRMIWVTFSKEGIHNYPEALSDPSLATGKEDDVSFLGYPHRHIFHFKVWIEVLHSNRDIEFIQFKRWLESLYADNTLTLNNKSCEMISDDLYSHIAQRYPDRNIHISVSEDNENGSMIFYNTTKPYQTVAI